MSHRIASALVVILLAGCQAPPRVVEVPTPIFIPGPVQYREIQADLLRCSGRPNRLQDGLTGGQLISQARAWQAYALCVEGRLEEIERLSAPVG